MNNNIWHSENGALLKQLRTSAQLDELVFARSNAISLTQLLELEGLGQGSFYTEHIKAHTGYKLLRKLGHEPVFSPPQALDVRDAIAVADPVLSAPAQPVLLAETRLTAQTATALTSGPTVSTHDPSSTSPGLVPADGRFRSQWLFYFLLLAAAIWAVVNTPWASLLARISPYVNISPVQSSASTTHPDSAQLRVDLSKTLTPPINSTHATQATIETPATPALLSCDWRHEASSVLYEASAPVKAGNYIHFVALKDGIACVRDQENKLTTLQLKAGMSKSVYGTPPFLVHSAAWSNLHLYFQGRRVAGTPNGEGHWVFKNKDLPAQGIAMTSALVQTGR